MGILFLELCTRQLHGYSNAFLFSWFSSAFNKKKTSFAEVGGLGRLVSSFSSAGILDSFTLEICALNLFQLISNCVNRSILFYSLSAALRNMHVFPKLNTTNSESRVGVSHNTTILVSTKKFPGMPVWVLPFT